MEGFTGMDPVIFSKGAEPGGLVDKSPQVAKSRYGFEARSPPWKLKQNVKLV